MKKNVKATVSLFRLLIEHSQKEYEPSPEHILKRMLLSLCRNFAWIAEKGTKNDAWDAIQGFSKECRNLLSLGIDASEGMVRTVSKPAPPQRWGDVQRCVEPCQ